MAVKLSNSIPELLRCRILVVVCEPVMVRFISTPLFPERLYHDFLVFFSFFFLSENANWHFYFFY